MLAVRRSPGAALLPGSRPRSGPGSATLWPPPQRASSAKLGSTCQRAAPPSLCTRAPAAGAALAPLRPSNATAHVGRRGGRTSRSSCPSADVALGRCRAAPDWRAEAEAGCTGSSVPRAAGQGCRVWVSALPPCASAAATDGEGAAAWGGAADPAAGFAGTAPGSGAAARALPGEPLASGPGLAIVLVMGSWQPLKAALAQAAAASGTDARMPVAPGTSHGGPNRAPSGDPRTLSTACASPQPGPARGGQRGTPTLIPKYSLASSPRVAAALNRAPLHACPSKGPGTPSALPHCSLITRPWACDALPLALPSTQQDLPPGSSFPLPWACAAPPLASPSEVEAEAGVCSRALAGRST